MDPFVLDAQTWAATQFATADLHDKRRTDRLVYLATQITAHPSGSFPEQTESWNDLRAAYNLFDCDEVTFQAIASPHWELTKKTSGELLLIISDTTEIDYGPCRQVVGLSPVGSGTGQGFHLHSGLMVSAEEDRVHGLAGQLIYHRQPVREGETRTERLQRDDRESQIWGNLVVQIGSPPSGTSWVHVVDRGADDFEFFYHCQQTRTEWVARAKNLNRIIITPEGGETPLRSYLGTLPEAGRYTLNLRARPNQPARTAKLVIAFRALSMPTPRLKSPFLKQVKPVAIPMWVVWVREVDAPKGVDPIQWVLYTSLPVQNLEGAMLIVGYYEKRWLIEEWHKVLKTGFQVERRQLKTCDRLEAMMGLMSVEAVRLFQLKGEARTAPERPAAEVVPPKYVKVLKAVRKLAPAMELTVGRFFRELAKLGGFLGRRGDGEPGWITIWRGWHKLQVMIRGAEAMIGICPCLG
jgi:Transposase DNA-binding/Transposase Tn5 dimerisation domain